MPYLKAGESRVIRFLLGEGFFHGEGEFTFTVAVPATGMGKEEGQDRLSLENLTIPP